MNSLEMKFEANIAIKFNVYTFPMKLLLHIAFSFISLHSNIGEEKQSFFLFLSRAFLFVSYFDN